MVPDHSNSSKSEVVPYRFGLPQTVSWLGCLRDPIPSFASFFDTCLASSVLLRVYILYAPDFHRPALWISRPDTTLPAASAEPPLNSERMPYEFLRLSLRLQNYVSKRIYRLAILSSYDLSLNHEYRHYSLFITRLLRVTSLNALSWPPRLGPTIRFRMTKFDKWSPIIQTPPNSRSFPTVLVCLRPYPGLVVSETPFVLLQVFSTPASHRPCCCVCISCTRRTSIVLPSGSLAPTLPVLQRVLSPPSIRRECHANPSVFPSDSKTMYLSEFIA